MIHRVCRHDANVSELANNWRFKISVWKKGILEFRLENRRDIVFPARCSFP